MAEYSVGRVLVSSLVLGLKYTSGVQPMRSLVPCWRVFQPNLRLHGNRSSQNLVLRWLDTTGVPQPSTSYTLEY